MMPKRVAETDPNKQIADFTGSGPSSSSGRVEARRQDRLRQERQVQAALRAALPASPAARSSRSTASSGAPSPITSRPVNALLAGEIDFIEAAAARPAAAARRRPNVNMLSTGTRSATSTPSASTGLHKPFDNPKVRQALMYAFNQEDFLKARGRRPRILQGLQLLFPCGTPSRARRAWRACSKSDFKKAQELLKEAGYDGTPIVLMHSTDLAVLTNLAPVAKSLLEKAGFKVDMQSMDWQTLVARRAKKDPPTRAAGTPS